MKTGPENLRQASPSLKHALILSAIGFMTRHGRPELPVIKPPKGMILRLADARLDPSAMPAFVRDRLEWIQTYRPFGLEYTLHISERRPTHLSPQDLSFIGKISLTRTQTYPGYGDQFRRWTIDYHLNSMARRGTRQRLATRSLAYAELQGRPHESLQVVRELPPTDLAELFPKQLATTEAWQLKALLDDFQPPPERQQDVPLNVSGPASLLLDP
jgi:hypothetical protein